MAAFRLIVSLALLSLASGARISTRAMLDARTRSDTSIGPDGEPWLKGTMYACMQKWEHSKSKFVESFCLAKLDDVKSIVKEHLALVDIEKCKGTKDTTQMKMCALKGDKPENKRVSYSNKVHIPNGCFRFSGKDSEYDVDVVEAAVDESECEMKLTEDDQGILPEETSTTPTTSSSTTTSEEAEVDSAVREDVEELIEAKTLFTSGPNFFWEYRGKAMKCCVSSAGKPLQLQDMNVEELPDERGYGKKTGCGRMFGDTYHNGMKSYKESEPTCPLPASFLADIIFEAKALFTSGDDLVWEYKGKAIKCCVSSGGKATMLQDLSATDLPQERSIGKVTGCGRMFGDKYHNGLKSYKGSVPTCPVPVTLLMKIAGDDYGSFASMLE